MDDKDKAELERIASDAAGKAQARYGRLCSIKLFAPTPDPLSHKAPEGLHQVRKGKHNA